MSEYEVVNENPYWSTFLDSILEKNTDYELIEDQTLQKLRVASARMIKNNFIAATAQQTNVNAVFGGEIKIGLLTQDKTQKDQVKSLLEKQFKAVDYSREYSFDQILEQIINSSFKDGDILVNLPIDKYYTGEVKTYVELVEARRIKTPPKHRSNDLVKEGVEYYANGKLKGYWVIKKKKDRSNVTYYSAQDEDFEFFPVYKSDGNITRKVCWLFKAPLNLTASQSRQFPMVTGIMGLVKFTNQLLEAVLIGVRVAACFAGFITTNDPAGTRAGTTEDETNSGIRVKGKKLSKLQPGILSYLKPNEGITFGQPNRPSDNFDPFLTKLCRFIAAYFRIPYEQFFLDLGVTNYSSWRGGSLEVQRNIKRWRRDLTAVIRWIIMTWLQEGVIKKVVNGSLKNLRIQIIFPKFQSLDEEKSARADKIELASKSTSPQRVQEGKGEDYDELQQELTDAALTETDRLAEVLIRQKKHEEENDIIFPSEGKPEEREAEKRPGETDLTEEEDKKERRKADGNE